MILFKDQNTGIAVTAVYLGFLYGTLGIVRPLLETAHRYGMQGFLLTGLSLLFGGIFVYLTVFVFKARQWVNYLSLSVLVFLWYLLFAYSVVVSAERFHFLEYGLLTILVFYTLRFSIRDRFLYFWSALAVSLAGYLDEGIQYYLPDRVYDPRDALLNGAAGVLTLFLIGFVWQEEL